MTEPCKRFVEDPYVCYSDGEPKGQCFCGFKEEDHRSDWKVFKVGDRAKAKKLVVFFDNSRHEKDEVLTVTELTVSYFNVCQKDYEKV